MEQALGFAYRNNPQLNAQRSSTRATDENVPTALAGYRPRVTGTSSLTEQYLDNLTKTGTTPAAPRSSRNPKAAAAASSFGLTTTQTLFNGFHTANRTRQAEQCRCSPRCHLHRTTTPEHPTQRCYRLHEPAADGGRQSSSFSAAT